MRWPRVLMLGLLCMTTAVPANAWAASPGVVLTHARAELLGASSIQFKLMACLTRGDIAGAIMLYEAETGEAAPSWLMQLQGAYAVTQRVAGSCQQVARIIHTAFTKLGQSPQYIAFKAKGDESFMIFDLVGGRQAPVSRNAYHVAVRVGDLIYDAYTGPLGMRMEEYLSRIHAVRGIAWQEVVTP